MKVISLDHLVLTVTSLERTREFYEILGMRFTLFDQGRAALHFGGQKINLHEKGREYEPKARYPMPGSGDLCFLVDTPVEDVINHLEGHGLSVIEGPVQRTGAAGPLLSIYVRDPDNNLVELSNRIAGGAGPT